MTNTQRGIVEERLASLEKCLAALESKMASLVSGTAQSRPKAQTHEESEDPPEDIPVMGLIWADVQRVGDILKKLHGSGDRYLSDLRIASGASDRIQRRLAQLISNAEAYYS